MALSGGPAEQVNFSIAAGWQLWSGHSLMDLERALVWCSFTTLGLKTQREELAHELDRGVEINPELQEAGWFVDAQDCELDPSSILPLSFRGSPEAAFTVQDQMIPSRWPSCKPFLGKSHIDSFTQR